MRLVAVDQCVGCGSAVDPKSKVFELSDPWKITDDRFRVVRCTSCKTWVLSPRPSPEEMPRFYEDGFLYEERPDKPSLISRLAARVQSLNLASEVNWVCRNLPNGSSYLDYSAGNGQILEALAKRRPDGTFAATEYSAAFRPAIKRRLPSATVCETLGELPHDARYDVISAFGVFEHVENPMGLLRNLREILAPKGTLLISIPNPESVQARLFGRKWYSWVAPRHFQLMPRKTFVAFANRAGLEVTGEHHFFLRTAPSSLALSAFPSLDPLQRPGTLKLLAYGALFSASLPMEWIFSKAKASGFMGFKLRAAE